MDEAWAPPEVGPISLLTWPPTGPSPVERYAQEVRKIRNETELAALVERWAEWWRLPFADSSPEGLPSGQAWHCLRLVRRGNGCRHLRRQEACRGQVVGMPQLARLTLMVAHGSQITEAQALYLLLRPSLLLTFMRREASRGDQGPATAALDDLD